MERVPFDPAAVREEIVKTFGHALKLRQVSAGGDASVEMELNATGNVNFDFGRCGVEFTASPRHADGVVLTGPVTANMAEALEICYDAVAEPKLLVVCGSEACSGGLYAASRAVEPFVLRTSPRRPVAARRPDPSDDLHRRHPYPASQKTTLI